MSSSIIPEQFISLILIAGGSFNPITIAHLRMFELAKDYYEKVAPGQYIVTNGVISPVNDLYGEKKNLVMAKDRVAMARLAVNNANLPGQWIQVSDWETRQSEWVRTIRVLKYHQSIADDVNKDLPGAQRPRCRFLSGADLLESFAKPGLWHDEDIEEIIKNYGLVVITRSGSDAQKFVDSHHILAKFRDQIDIVTEPISNEISATKVREAIRGNYSIKYFVADPVIQYIKENNLYKN